ncbi:MAG: ABC transporter ATP-binding protein [Lachnospiraceae bacterium]|jgi:teichoic acid transport system ATP-binding protein
MSEAAIKVEHLSKMYKLYDKPIDRLKESLKLTRKQKYKEHYALRDVSFQVNKGETIGIIGTNGSGKSTILKIITGVLNPTEGEVTVDGRISALLELGAGFNQEYTGIENVYLNGTMTGFSEEEITAKLDDILAFADIGDFVYQPVKTYSSGMFVRLAFAVAINIEPEILIVDEALSVGDVFFQAKCYKKFEEFKALGKTILLVSHDLGSVSQYCDRVVLLNKGVVLDQGSPKEMIDLYKKVLVEEVSGTEGKKQEEEETEEMKVQEASLREGKQDWKSYMLVSPDMQNYGNKKAEIVDFGLFDETDQITNTVYKMQEFSVRMRVYFHETIVNPIFAFSLKDIKGNELTGTNTVIEKTDIGTVNAGELVEIEFKQVMRLQKGQYLLQLGCTGFVGEEFVVYNRLYDSCCIQVVSNKTTVGYFDMDTTVVFNKGV